MEPVTPFVFRANGDPSFRVKQLEPAGRPGNCVAFDGHVAGGTVTPSASAEQEDIVSELSPVPACLAPAIADRTSLAAAPEPRPQLSAREVEVLLAWILGETKGEVCRKLFIAPGTVNTHLARIREKYRAAGRPAPTKAALLARALQDGYLDLDDI